MSDLISRSALLEELNDSKYAWQDYDAVEGALRNIPAVDAAEVVKCRDCFYWMKAKVNRSGGLVCPKSGMEILATDYCSKAEKRKCHYDK